MFSLFFSLRVKEQNLNSSSQFTQLWMEKYLIQEISANSYLIVFLQGKCRNDVSIKWQVYQQKINLHLLWYSVILQVISLSKKSKKVAQKWIFAVFLLHLHNIKMSIWAFGTLICNIWSKNIFWHFITQIIIWFIEKITDKLIDNENKNELLTVTETYICSVVSDGK